MATCVKTEVQQFPSDPEIHCNRDDHKNTAVTNCKSITNVQENEGQTVSRITWRHFWMCPCLILHIYSFMFYTYVITQYIFMRIQNEKFPELSTNESVAVCDAKNESSATNRESIEVQKLASNWSLYNSLSFSIPAIFLDVIIVSLSDRYGRRIPVILTLIGTFVKSIFAAISVYLEFNVYLFIIFSFIEGIAGGWCCVLALGFAYVADLSKSGKNRTRAIVLLNVSFGVGLVLSGVTSGYVIKNLGYFYAMILLTASNGFNLLMTVVLLPESLSQQHETKTNQTIRNAFIFYVKDTSEKSKKWKYLVCITVFFLQNCVTIGRSGLDALYQLDHPFCWNSVKIGWYASISNAVRNIISQVFIAFLQFCLWDELLGILSLISNVLSECLQAFAFNDITMFMVPVVGMFTTLADPIVRSIMSKMTSADKQGHMTCLYFMMEKPRGPRENPPTCGALFAGIAVVQTVCGVAGELITKTIYTATLAHFRGFVYLVLAGMSLVSLILMIILVLASRRQQKTAIQPVSD